MSEKTANKPGAAKGESRAAAGPAGSPAVEPGSAEQSPAAPSVPSQGSDSVADPVAGAAAPLVVQCPQCAVPADAQSLCCPSCHEDLVALVRLRYAGRIAFNDALGLLRAGRREAAAVALERAVALEPGLEAAERLLARLGGERAPAAAVGA